MLEAVPSATSSEHHKRVEFCHSLALVYFFLSIQVFCGQAVAFFCETPPP